MTTAISINILTDEEQNFFTRAADFNMLIAAISASPESGDFWKGVRDDYYPDPCYMSTSDVESDIDFWVRESSGENSRDDVSRGLWDCVEEVPASIVEKIKTSVAH
jgi:hypothetical protein